MQSGTDQIKLLSFLEERIGTELDAVITGVDRFGFFCRGTELPAEGLVHVSTFPQKDNFDFDRDVMTLTGRRTGQVFRLGDRVRVAVAHVDVDRRNLTSSWSNNWPRPAKAKIATHTNGEISKRTTGKKDSFQTIEVQGESAQPQKKSSSRKNSASRKKSTDDDHREPATKLKCRIARVRDASQIRHPIAKAPPSK
ncbi:MAG: S1 RNA-binding domain-containing protein [Planctomycetaceae bacterium]